MLLVGSALYKCDNFFEKSPLTSTAMAKHAGFTGTLEPIDWLSHSSEPCVTYLEIFRFIYWATAMILIQAWTDIKAYAWYKPVLSTDFLTHYLVRD